MHTYKCDATACDKIFDRVPEDRPNRDAATQHFCCRACKNATVLKREKTSLVVACDNCGKPTSVKQCHLAKYAHSFCNTSCSRKFMVGRQTNTTESIARAHETRKRNGTFGKSKDEDALFVMLCKHFNDDQVIRQEKVNGWAIDFYVKSIDTYIQLDGIYWHGLDRPLEVIAEHKTKTDVTIRKTYLRDRLQDAYFAENGLRLVRVTDNDFKRMGDATINLLLTTS